MFKGVHYIYDFTNIKTNNIELYQKKINIILDKIISESNLNQIDKSENFSWYKPHQVCKCKSFNESHISPIVIKARYFTIDILLVVILKMVLKQGIMQKYILENLVNN